MKPMQILLVEDNQGDVRLTREAFIESQVPSVLHVVTDGAAALDFLGNRGIYSKAARPDLILLDLNLPKLSGREVLTRIKEHRIWRSIPVVVLTTSSSDLDVMECYDHHANCYMVKPAAYVPFLELVKGIESFWLELVQLPPRSQAALVSKLPIH